MANIWRKNKELQVSPAELVISLDIPWFTASPDDLVYNPAKNPPHGIMIHIPQETMRCMKLSSQRAFA